MRTFRIFSRDERIWEVKMTVSSAYCRCEILGPFLQISIPDHKLCSVALLIIRFKTSAANTNRNGDNGSPCRNPRWSLNGEDGEPFINTEATADEIHFDIHNLHCGGKPIWVRTHSKKAQETQSKALWKSNLRTTAFDFLRLHESRSSPAIRALSSICLPFMNADWWDPTKHSSRF